MTTNASPDLLDLAEAVAAGELRAADAERQIEAAQVPELRGLILAATAVRSHARATHEAAITEETERAHSGTSISTMVTGAVGGATVQRHSSHNGEARAPRRTWLLLAATIAVGTGLIGLSVIGGGLVAPNPEPTATNAVSTTAPSAAPTQSAVAVQPTPAPARFAYIKAADTHTLGQLWVANADGTGALELVPDLGGNQQGPVWSPMGTRLLFSRAPAIFDHDGYPSTDFSFYLTDASGSPPQLLHTGCVAPCTVDGDAAFSPDGTHLVFVRSLDIPATPQNPGISKTPNLTQASVVATIDLASGRVTELASTMIVDCPLLPDQHAPGVPNCAGLKDHEPRWSADGTQIVFAQDVPYDINDRSMYGDLPPTPGPVLSVVNADGTDLHQVSSGHTGSADWSQDGTRIVFESGQYLDIVPNRPLGNGWTYTPSDDTYTIRPDGTDLRQLTSDGEAQNPTWTADGRIVFRKYVPELEGWAPWVMDADGSNAIQLSSTPWLGVPNQPAIAALTGR